MNTDMMKIDCEDCGKPASQSSTHGWVCKNNDCIINKNEDMKNT